MLLFRRRKDKCSVVLSAKLEILGRKTLLCERKFVTLHKTIGRKRSFRQRKHKPRLLLAVWLCVAHFSWHKKQTGRCALGVQHANQVRQTTHYIYDPFTHH